MAFDGYSMNKQHESHLNKGLGHKGKHGSGAGDVEEKSGQHRAPHIHIHSHSKGHTVHVMHSDGGHDQHEHAPGDAEGIAEHIHNHIGAAGGQPVGGESNMPAPEEEFD